MFPFDQKRALDGEPMITRDGRPTGSAFPSDDQAHPIRVCLLSGVAPYYTSEGKTLNPSDDVFMVTQEPWTRKERIEYALEMLGRGIHRFAIAILKELID